MVLLLWFGKVRYIAPLLILILWLASLFLFNRDPGWDACALYFFGSHGLGAAAWWASGRKHGLVWLCMLAVLVVAALIVDFRLRLAVALTVAMVLGLNASGNLLAKCTISRGLAYSGRISYSVFLVHFPVSLIVNALFVRFGCLTPAAAVFGLLAAWAASIAVAALFYRLIEAPSVHARITAAIDFFINLRANTTYSPP